MPDRPLRSPPYAILSTGFAKARAPMEILGEFLSAGVKLVQLRAKEESPGDFFTRAKEARELTRRAGATLIINDRVDVALAVRADGVHLGQDDLTLKAARKILADTFIIGISTHDVAQERA